MLICKPVECLPEASGFVGVSEKKIQFDYRPM